LRLLKTGRCERRGSPPQDAGREDDDLDHKGKRLDVRVIAMSDGDLPAEMAAGRFRHDLYYRLARVVLSLPPLRERKSDIGPAVVWMGNRILRAAGVPLDLLGPEDYRHATPDERDRAIALEPGALQALGEHTWPGNFRELETVLERALLLYRQGARLSAAEVAAALEGPPPAVPAPPTRPSEAALSGASPASDRR
jgi:DNA-binding NtrC family response regulator